MKIILKGIERLEKVSKQASTLRVKVNDTITTRMNLFGRALVLRSREAYLSGRPGLQAVTGNLRRSIRYQISGNENEKTITFGTNVVYARIHEYGGTIQPVRARLLYFKVGGKSIFAKSVRIPERPFLRPAVSDEAPIFIRTLNTTLRDLVKGNLAA